MERESSNEARLDELFQAYRAAYPLADASTNFMPDVWAGIDARRVSTNWFGRVAKALVIAAVAASVILGTMVSPADRSSAFFDGTFVEALRADRVSTLEPLHMERIAQLESQ